MNILYYCSEYPPYIHGGIGSVLKTEAEEMAKRGHNVYVIGYYRQAHKCSICENINGVRVYRYSLGLFNSRYVNKLNAYFCKLGMVNPFAQIEIFFIESKIRGIIRKYNIDIFECPDYIESSSKCPNLRFHKFSECKTVLRLHGSATYLRENEKQNKTTKYIYDNDRRHFACFDHLCGVSNYIINYTKNKFSDIKFLTESCINNPVKSELLIQKNSPTNNSIFFSSKISKNKGCFSLIKAFNLIARKYPKLTIRMLGNGDFEHAKSLIEPEFRDRIVFLGFCDAETVLKEIDSCLLACLPSYFECFSIAALEVMARSKCLIFTQTTSGPEIIQDKIDGLLVDPENPNDIAEKLCWAIEHEEECREIANRAFAKVRDNYTVEAIAGKLDEYYTSLLYTNS